MGNWKRRRREAANGERKKPFTTRGLGERRKLPSGVWGRAPETDTIFNNFLAKLSTFWVLVNLIFCNNQFEKVGLCLYLLENYYEKLPAYYIFILEERRLQRYYFFGNNIGINVYTSTMSPRRVV